VVVDPATVVAGPRISTGARHFGVASFCETVSAQIDPKNDVRSRRKNLAHFWQNDISIFKQIRLDAFTAGAFSDPPFYATCLIFPFPPLPLPAAGKSTCLHYPERPAVSFLFILCFPFAPRFSGLAALKPTFKGNFPLQVPTTALLFCDCLLPHLLFIFCMLLLFPFFPTRFVLLRIRWCE
jgi:hypothetical protein